MFRKPAKYRPGIDDPPASRWMWLAGVLGLASVATFFAMLTKHLPKRSRSQ